MRGTRPCGSGRKNLSEVGGEDSLIFSAVDNTDPGQGAGIVAGATVHFQGWYRDPAGPCGSGFNLTNGYSVVFVP